MRVVPFTRILSPVWYRSVLLCQILCWASVSQVVLHSNSCELGISRVKYIYIKSLLLEFQKVRNQVLGVAMPLSFCSLLVFLTSCQNRYLKSLTSLSWKQSVFFLIISWWHQFVTHPMDPISWAPNHLCFQELPARWLSCLSTIQVPVP